MKDELPEGWDVVKLPEVCQLNPGKPDASRVTGDTQVTFVPMAAVDAELGQITKPILRAYTEVSKGFTAFQENDVIMAKITPCMENGKAAIARGLSNGIGFGSTEFHVLRHNRAILPEYLFYFIRQDSFRGSAEASMTGSVGQKRVPLDFLRDTVLPLPPTNEQLRIVARLEELLSRVDAAQARLATIPRILKRFRQSVLAAACSGKLTADWRKKNANRSASSLLDKITKRRKELWAKQRKAKGLAARPTDYPEPATPSDEFDFEVPESWETCSMDALTNVITSGSRDWKRYYRDDGCGTFIMAQNIRPMRFDSSYRLAVAPPENDRDRARSEVFKEDLLVTIVGANTGDSCRVPLELREHYVCQSVALMRPVLPSTSPFLEVFLNSTGHGLAQYKKWIYGEGRPHLSFDHLRETLVCLPPLAEQQEIVRRVEALFKTADALEARYHTAKTYVDKLTQSILAKAFRGELVPQDPNDEPASALIEDIRQQSSGHRVNKRGKKVVGT